MLRNDDLPQEPSTGNLLPSRLSSNSAWLLLSRIATQVGLAAFTVLVARGLGTVGFGEYAFIASVIFIGNVVTTFGTDMLLIREIAATGDLADLSPALVLQLLLSALFIVVVFAASGLTRSANAAVIVSLRIYSLSLFPLAFFTVFTTALRGRQHMRAYSLLNAALSAMQFIVALWLFLHHGDLIQLAILLLLVQLVAALMAGVLCRSAMPGELRWLQPSFDRLLSIMKAGAPIALLGVLGVVYQRSTLLLLPVWAGAAGVGWFSAGARVLEAAKTGHIAVLTALYPMMAAKHAGSPEGSPRGFRMPGLFLFSAGLAGSLMLSVLAAPLVRLLFGPQFLPSVPILRILAWALTPYAVNSFLTLAFLARREEQTVVRALAGSTGLLILLIVWWTPSAGAVGAAWAALCAESAQAVYLLSRELRNSRGLTDILRTSTLRD